MNDEKNYITPKGYARLEAEFRRLKYTERPEVTQVVSWAAGNGDRSENGDYLYGKKRLREIDRELRILAKKLESAEVVDPEKIDENVIRFGATVRIADEEGIEKVYSIVGIDEIDPSRGLISWKSPLASCLFNKREGDLVTFKSPRGAQEIEILSIEYIVVDV